MNNIKVIDSPMGTGKALPYGSKLYTKDTVMNIEESVVGSEVYCEDGELHKIVGVYPQGVKDIYEIKFSDGTLTECTEDHIWTIKSPLWVNGKDLPLKSLLNTPLYADWGDSNGTYLYEIPITKPVNFKDKETKIKLEDDIKEIPKNFLLKENGFFSYIHNSVSFRKKMLYRVLNKNCYTYNGEIVYTENITKLEEMYFLKELVESLGGTGRIKLDSCIVMYIRLSYATKALTESNKKIAPTKQPRRFITSINKRRFSESVCISVDNPTHLFLTDSFVVTHNTVGAINMINKQPKDTRTLFVTPFLKECERVITGCKNKHFEQPEIKKKKTKTANFKSLLKNKKNIVCTHSLFNYIDIEILNLIKDGNYILILDESLNIISSYGSPSGAKSTKNDNAKCLSEIEKLVNIGLVKIEESGKVVWSKDESMQLNGYRDMIKASNMNMLYCMEDNTLVKMFPVNVFNGGFFKDIYMLTYLFDGQIQSAYFKINNIPYDFYHIEKVNEELTFVPTINHEYEREWKKKVKKLITIYDSYPLNEIGESYLTAKGARVYSSLSSSWYAQHKKEHKIVADSNYNFLRRAPAEKRMFTCFKRDLKSIKHKKIGMSSYVPVNSKATNVYGDKTQCSYLVNRYINPFMKNIFSNNNVSFDQDLFAVSEMVQWVWRSAIRNDVPIELYIPSRRMRYLFTAWLNDKPIYFETSYKFEGVRIAGKRKKNINKDLKKD